MRLILVFSTIIVVISLLISGCGQQEPTVEDIHGRTFNLSQYHKWIVVNYWAQWCHHCRQEVQQLNALYRQHSRKVLVLGVNFEGKSASKLRPIANQLNIQYPVIRQFPIDHYDVTHISGIPMTFIINPKGRMVNQLSGSITKAKLEQIMELSHD